MLRAKLADLLANGEHLYKDVSAAISDAFIVTVPKADPYRVFFIKDAEKLH